MATQGVTIRRALVPELQGICAWIEPRFGAGWASEATAATLLMAAAILLETALSFLGYGVQAPDTSLGKIISENQAAFATRPWLFWWPGVFIIFIALSINFIGDGLRDAFDPRTKRIPSQRQMDKAMAQIATGNPSTEGAK